MAEKLNEAVVAALPAPKSGNKITFYPESVIQGAKAPRGFGVRVTAAGSSPRSSGRLSLPKFGKDLIKLSVRVTQDIPHKAQMPPWP